MSLTLYEDVEKSLVDRLKPLEALPKIVVEAMPENQAGYNRTAYDARIWVMYESSEFGTPRSTMVPIKDMGNAVQEETITYKVLVQARKIRGENGIYHLVKLIKSRLIGFEPNGLDKLIMVMCGWAERDQSSQENLWSYILTFATKGISIEEVQDENLPGLQSVDFDDTYTS